MVYVGPSRVNSFSSITTQTVANSILAGFPFPLKLQAPVKAKPHCGRAGSVLFLFIYPLVTVPFNFYPDSSG
ncbi:hypothetical protein A3860_27090 [Niastella vici]|uniref:Uncharacterized protein n=1 Tax=Niastella vici TaxID=1703345 RepID=A0A1V9FWI4_9BACT|nr:hypothetical protein A3860_27090 [Niastella vici]